MRPLAHALFDDMLPFAAMLDSAYGGTGYAETLRQLRERIERQIAEADASEPRPYRLAASIGCVRVRYGGTEPFETLLAAADDIVAVAAGVIDSEGLAIVG